MIQQLVIEGFLFTVNIGMVVMAVMDLTRKDHPIIRWKLGSVIIVCNYAFEFLPIAFVTIKLFFLAKKVYLQRKLEKSKTKVCIDLNRIPKLSLMLDKSGCSSDTPHANGGISNIWTPEAKKAQPTETPTFSQVHTTTVNYTHTSNTYRAGSTRSLILGNRKIDHQEQVIFVPSPLESRKSLANMFSTKSTLMNVFMEEKSIGYSKRSTLQTIKPHQFGSLRKERSARIIRRSPVDNEVQEEMSNIVRPARSENEEVSTTQLLDLNSMAGSVINQSKAEDQSDYEKGLKIQDRKTSNLLMSPNLSLTIDELFRRPSAASKSIFQRDSRDLLSVKKNSNFSRRLDENCIDDSGDASKHSES